jgi:peptide chain release factor-like protein
LTPLHPAALPDDALLAQCEVLRSRGSGPGGRHRNSTDSRVTLRHRPTRVEAAAGERRSQHDNRRVALFRLRLALATEVRTVLDRPVPPSELWLSRVRDRRISVNPAHRDFPALLAEALDVVAAELWDLHAAAEHLHVSPTQLVRFLSDHPPALVEVNRHRAERGMPALKR